MKRLNRLETIREIAIRNEITFEQSMKDYTRCSCRVYTKNKGDLPYGHPDLEERIFIMTEKYIGIQKWRNLRKKI